MNGIDLPFLTAGIPGIGGTIKREADDFLVEELPLYRPCGEGEHVYLWIEKRGIATPQAIGLLARALHCPRGAIGWAGLKDAQARTRQYLSVQGVPDERFAALSELEGICVLERARHRNKLKIGHLAGNRFDVRIRGPRPGALRDARAALALLSARGLPNGFGAQRFGNAGNTGRLGRALLQGDGAAFFRALLSGIRDGLGMAALERLERGELSDAADALPAWATAERRFVELLRDARGDFERAARRIDRDRRRLYLSALQAEVFNRVLAARFDDFDRVRSGDLAWLHRNGACFRVDDAAAEGARASAFEISASGPLHGARCARPGGEPLAIEEAVLREAALDREEFARCRDLEGARRPLRVPLANASIDPMEPDEGGDLRLRVELPPGAYATQVLRELMKDGAPPADPPGGCYPVAFEEDPERSR